MTYELAKRLEDAGFKTESGLFVEPGESMCSFGNGPISAEAIELPTLSELISACGDNFGGLKHEWKGDSVTGLHLIHASWEIGKPFEEIYGSSDEESVANLWLAINKKIS